MVMTHIKLKRMTNAATYYVLKHTFNPRNQGKSQNILFLNVVMLHIKLKGSMQANEPQHMISNKCYAHVLYPTKGFRIWVL